MNSEFQQQYLRFYGFDVLLAEDVTHYTRCVEVHSEQVVAHHFEVPSPVGVVFLCHGYYDHVGLYGHLIAYYLNRQLNVVTFDQIGHGLSSGEPATIPNFDDYVEAALCVLSAAGIGYEAKDVIWSGQSMGGAVVLETLQQNPQFKPRDIVLFAPLVRPYAWWFARWVFLVAKYTITARPRKITQNADNQEFMYLQNHDPLQAKTLPVQWVAAMVEWFQRFEAYPQSELAAKVVQGHADKTISWRHGTRLLKKRYPNSQWLILPEAGHHLVNESDCHRDTLFKWLDEVVDWPKPKE